MYVKTRAKVVFVYSKSVLCIVQVSTWYIQVLICSKSDGCGVNINEKYKHDKRCNGFELLHIERRQQ